jgi:glycosyltransferase involved in cell wall biosynthesis
LRLLVVTSIFPADRSDPAGSFILDQALALSARGHAVDVVVMERRGGPLRTNLWDLASVRSVPYVAVPLRFGVPLWARSVERQMRSLRSDRIDVALVHDELVAMAVHPALERWGIPWVLVVHGENRNPALARRAGLRARNDVYGRADGVVTVGIGVRVPIWVPARQIPNGAAVLQAPADPPERLAAVMALSVSGLRPGKGIEDNLEALARVRADGAEVGYWIGGEGPLRAELDARTDRLGLRDHVRFLGSVRRDRLAALLGAADLFSLPSSPEAFGISTLEAMQAGRPVIACRGEGPEGFVSDGVDGFLITPGDVDGLTAAWKTLSTDAGLRERMGAHARSAAAPITWSANAERIESVLADALRAHQPSAPGRDLWWLGVEPTSYMLDKGAAVREVVPDHRRAFIDGGGDVSTTRLLAAIARRRARVVLVEGWGHPTMLLAMALATLARVPYVVASDSHEPAGGRRGPIRRAIRATAIRPLVRRAAVLFPGGTPQARYVRELVGSGGQPVVLGHMTVDTDGFGRAAQEITREERDAIRSSWGCAGADVALLFVGRLVEQKGVMLLARALERLSDASVRLVVVGAGPLERELRSMADRLPIHLVGPAGKDALASVYASADVFVLPSRSEPWGLVVNEAMASGLPCVVSDAVGCREDLITPEQTGLVFASGDLGALVAAVARLAADPAMRRRIGVAAQARMRDWSMATYAASVAEAVAVARGTSV